MTNAQHFLGYPIYFEGKIPIYSPFVSSIVSNKNFPRYQMILETSQEEIQDIFAERETEKEGRLPTPFEFLLVNSYENEDYYLLARQAFKFFTHLNALFLFDQGKIVLSDLEIDLIDINSLDNLSFIDESNFFNFQNAIRLAIGAKEIEPPVENEDPRVARIKAKARYRDKIKAKQNIGLSLTTTLASICCMNLGLNPLNVGEITYAAMITLMNIYQEKEKFEIDIKTVTSGLGSKDVKPQYWIRNLN